MGRIEVVAMAGMLPSAAAGPAARRAGYHRGMATLTRADVEHVAHLARLGLTDAELDRLEGQLNHILDQYAILAAVPTDHIAPTAQTIELENILRDDVVTASLPVEDVLANAAAHEADFIVVPAILGD
jgi:aspartyl-tRNA(Asn)/glutamyl-tRNA(Gln) amidotransferase subunit C